MLRALKDMTRRPGVVYGFDAAFSRASRSLNSLVKFSQRPQIYSTVTPEGTSPMPVFAANGLQPLPPEPGLETVLIIESTPSGATVRIGGANFQRVTPFEYRPTIDVGGDAQIEVQLELPGYEPATRSILLRRGERAVETFVLSPTLSRSAETFVETLVSAEPKQFEPIRGERFGPPDVYKCTLSFPVLPESYIKVKGRNHEVEFRSSPNWNPTAAEANRLFALLDSACKPLLAKGWKLDSLDSGRKRNYWLGLKDVIVHLDFPPGQALTLSLKVSGVLKR